MSHAIYFKVRTNSEFYIKFCDQYAEKKTMLNTFGFLTIFMGWVCLFTINVIYISKFMHALLSIF